MRDDDGRGANRGAVREGARTAPAGTEPWRRVRAFADRALAWLYPSVCRGCGHPLMGCRDAVLCNDCHRRMPWLGEAACRRCGAMAGAHAADGHICRRCRDHPPAFARAAGVARYRFPARDLALGLKFGGDRTLADGMAALMAARARAAGFPAVDAVAPVPLHPARRRARGYNQAALLSRGVARRLGARHAAGALRRVIATVEQTSLAGAARRAFPPDAFRARGDWTGRRLLLVDDVVTTGATAHACATALRAAGAAAVYVVAFAR